MTEAAAPQQCMTIDEFFAWAETQEEPYELVDGVPVPLWPRDPAEPTMMAPPSRRHQDIVTNIVTVIQSRLRPRYWATAGLTVPIHRTGARVPDVVAGSMPHDEASNRVANPTLVVEVLSPASERYERSAKLDEYKLIGTMREIWLVASDRRWVQIWRRGADTWHGFDLTKHGEHMSRELEARVTISDLYIVKDDQNGL